MENGTTSAIPYSSEKVLPTTGISPENGSNDYSITVTVSHGGFREQSISHDDATWILTSAFIIFTMQSGK